MNNLNNVKNGDVFEFKGCKWICLDNSYEESGKKGIFCIMAEMLEYECFSKNCNNDYSVSNVREFLIKKLLPKLEDGDNLITHHCDLTKENGRNRYGATEDKVFLLSIQEYIKYSKYIPFEDENSDYSKNWWWLRSPYSTSAYLVRLIGTSGALSYSNALNTIGIAPACIINLAEG